MNLPLRRPGKGPAALRWKHLKRAPGSRNKAELKAMQKAFKSGEADVLPITQAISDAACTLVEK